ncbi:MAG: c-type cytochrome, partial [Planctomycetaceae bacterium]|nr:c-type cytochrome [Planctomycetaceae bacterium]
MRVIRPAFVVIFWLASVLTATAQAADQPAKSPIFETDILPIFKAKCASCHNPRAKKAELDLTTLDAVAKGGESGELIVGGKPDDSLLYEMIHEGLMPPEDFKKPLTKAEIETISRWIQAGAKSKNGDALSK